MSFYILPRSLREAVSGRITSKPDAKFALVGAIYQAYNKNEIPFCEWLEFPLQYFASVLGCSVKQASKHIKALKLTLIIESQDEYQPPVIVKGKKIFLGKCRKYRLSQRLVYGTDLEAINISITQRKLTPIEVEARYMLSKVMLPTEISSQIDRVAFSYAKTATNTISIRKSLREAENAFYGNLPVYVILGAGASRVTKIEFLRMYSERLDMFEVDGYKGYFLAPNAEALRLNFTQRRAIAYAQQLMSLNNAGIDAAAHRNDTNQRLDTCLTNVMSEFLVFIRIKGREAERLMSFDLVNSQFVILASQLRKHIENFRIHFSSPTKLYSDFSNMSRGGGLSSGGGQSLVFSENSLDSDPLFFSISVSKEKKEAKKRNMNPEIPEGQRSARSVGSGRTPLPPSLQPLIPYMFTFLSKLTDNERTNSISEMLFFCELAASGKLYENIASVMHFGRKLSDLTRDEKSVLLADKGKRKEAKEALFLVLFGKYATKNKLKASLARFFPYLVSFIDYTKKCEHERLKEEYEKDGDAFREKYKDAILRALAKKAAGIHEAIYAMGSNWLAIYLQRLESKIFIDGIFRELMRKKVWSASKHDSILFLESDIHRVEKVMRKHLDKKLGMAYQLRHEVFELSDEQRENIEAMKSLESPADIKAIPF